MQLGIGAFGRIELEHQAERRTVIEELRVAGSEHDRAVGLVVFDEQLVLWPHQVLQVDGDGKGRSELGHVAKPQVDAGRSARRPRQLLIGDLDVDTRCQATCEVTGLLLDRVADEKLCFGIAFRACRHTERVEALEIGTDMHKTQPDRSSVQGRVGRAEVRVGRIRKVAVKGHVHNHDLLGLHVAQRRGVPVDRAGIVSEADERAPERYGSRPCADREGALCPSILRPHGCRGTHHQHQREHPRTRPILKNSHCHYTSAISPRRS